MLVFIIHQCLKWLRIVIGQYGNDPMFNKGNKKVLSNFPGKSLSIISQTCIKFKVLRGKNGT